MSSLLHLPPPPRPGQAPSHQHDTEDARSRDRTGMGRGFLFRQGCANWFKAEAAEPSVLHRGQQQPLAPHPWVLSQWTAASRGPALSLHTGSFGLERPKGQRGLPAAFFTWCPCANFSARSFGDASPLASLPWGPPVLRQLGVPFPKLDGRKNLGSQGSGSERTLFESMRAVFEPLKCRNYKGRPSG